MTIKWTYLQRPVLAATSSMTFPTAEDKMGFVMAPDSKGYLFGGEDNNGEPKLEILHGFSLEMIVIHILG